MAAHQLFLGFGICALSWAGIFIVEDLQGNKLAQDYVKSFRREAG